MGRSSSSSSSSSCLKIIVCGSDSAENDDHIHSSQHKTSNYKRGWSFRKKSGRHRVLGNNVSSENATFADRETVKGGNIEFEAPIKSTFSIDEISKSVDEVTKPVDEILKPVEEISKPVDLTESHSEPNASVVMVTSENCTCTKSKVNLEEVALESITNETSVDSRMANESFISKDKSIDTAELKISELRGDSVEGRDATVIMDETIAIIIQTAMRGFLAQRKFVQLKSAVKLQAVIRGHLVRRNAIETLHCIRAIVRVQAIVHSGSSISLDLKNKPNNARFSTMKLLQNSFARQLESTLKSKSLNIGCDPMKPNSAWTWLARWMAVSTSDTVKISDPCVELETEDVDQKIACETDADLPSVVFSESIDLKLSVKEGAKLTENDEHHIGDEITSTNAWSTTPFATDTIEQTHLEEQEMDINDVGSSKTEAITTEISPKQSATSELNVEGKKFIYKSRKANNPAFIAAQSKFEELTSTSAAIPERATHSSHLDVGADSLVESDPCLSFKDSVEKTNKPGDTETSGISDPRIIVAGSECGTELSISSTLDSPDKSDDEDAELVSKAQVLGVEEKQDSEAIGVSSSSVTDIPQQEVHGIDVLSVDPVPGELNPPVEHKAESKEPNLRTDFAPECPVTNVDSPVAVNQKHRENVFNEGLEADRQAYNSSPEASPISHRTVTKSQGTPSSLASAKGKKNKIDKHGSNRKRSSPSAEQKSPSNRNADSGARSSTENLMKDHKSGKIRYSIASTISESADQEPRDSCNRNALPSYMQATESARAKASSPKSSPDVHDKEVYSKKRHSLPGVTGRHGSPHAKKTTSPSAQGSKGNCSNPSNVRRA
ncbi:protein IQ-DOMAIN 32-like isoform X2 [Amaranthus tricolor]|uniref:protein IQ-DOMAIN 32-like isoform X2 n=1 Tax=Amaranthus tricolor TaxID=29722 RepID=UPI0025863AAD|nr:protein IQ-DOMAIN 32-like isoform X2 [Amaranthus tricolor]